MDSNFSLLPQAAAQMRGALSSLYLAAARLAPAAAREEDPDLDARAALVDQSYYRLVRIVNNLAAARYLDGEPLQLQDLDIVEFVSELFAGAASLAPLRGLETRLLCAADRHLCAFCPDALEQLLYQLLSNAFKYTPAGGLITVELKLSAKRVLLTVEDTGDSIPPDRLAVLFDSCRQPPRLDQPDQGLGLGLLICQAIARGHGGVLTAESSRERGNRFTLAMPDRLNGAELRDLTFDYSGGFNRALMALADSLPPEAFGIRFH